MKLPFPLALALCLHPFATAPADDGTWQYSGALTILTTPEGADLPAGASLEGFPVLLRLHRDFFDFTQAKPGGEDLRFSDSEGLALAHEIEDWDAAKGTANVWIRIPRLEGNARQQVRMRWGNKDAENASSGDAVFNASNGFASVWHLGGEVRDVAGTLESRDLGTTPAVGMIGTARHFPGGKGVFGGETIPDYPSGEAPHSTEAWIRAEKPNATIIGWGNEGGGRGSKVRMQFRSPPHLHIDSDFSDVKGEGALPMGEWVHVAHTYGAREGKVYVNGRLDGAATPLLDIRRPARLWIGGWYHQDHFVGAIDEVRISRVARSPEWLRMAYENQKPLQTLLGTLILPGEAFSVSQSELTLPEGGNATITARADGAQKVYWSLLRDGGETPVATDRLAHAFEAGRTVGDQRAVLRFKAIYPDAVRTADIALTIREAVPEPEFTLRAPRRWDGRTTIAVVAEPVAGVGELKYTWAVAPLAVTRETAPDRLILTRAHHSGTLTVTATADNGGAPASRSVTIEVTEPERDPWVERAPDPHEQPEDGQFYARDDHNEGTLHYTGTLDGSGGSLYLKLFADDELVKIETGVPAADGTYALSTKLKPGLVKYRVEFGTVTAGRETVLHAAKDLVCGDAYLINGQSNAVATDWGEGEPTYRSEWIRTFGSASGSPEGVKLWGEATHRSREGEKLQVGYWAMELGQRLVENQKIPVFLINGAVGGTRIDQHQRSAENPEDMTTIYGRLLWRVRQEKLTHGLRGVIWHQGENDQGADGPTGGFGWETYRQYFIDLAAAWKQDYPNLRHYYVFQIWPKACSMGVNGSDNALREVQRTLPTAFSNLSVLSTLGIDPPGGCHYPAAGYAEFARLLYPHIARDHYGAASAASITSPDLKSGCLAGNEIVLEFDQPVIWDDALAGQFYVDGHKGRINSGRVEGNTLTLELAPPFTAETITYLDSKEWSQATLLRGENAVAALTFFEVPLPASLSASPP